MKFRKRICLFIVTLLALPMAFGLVSCNDNGNKTNVTAKDVYAISALSSVSYLQTIDNNTRALTTNNATTRPVNISENDVNGMKNCLGLFDGFINNGKIQHNTEKNTSTDEELKDYNFVMTISLFNSNNSIKMYYTEKETLTNKEIDDEGEEIKTSTTLEGIMIFENSKYDVVGKREIEEEVDEKEVSVEFKTISRVNSQNYIEVSKSIEEEINEHEVEYEYKIYVDGKLKQATELEFEKENDKVELEFKLKDLSNNQYNKTVYKLRKGQTENTFIVEFNLNGEKETINIEKTTTGYIFTYSNGYIENVNI